MILLKKKIGGKIIMKVGTGELLCGDGKSADRKNWGYRPDPFF